MKAAEARKLIGKQVEWDDILDAFRMTGTVVRSGYCTDVRGKNIMIDGDWKWLPKLLNLRERQPKS